MKISQNYENLLKELGGAALAPVRVKKILEGFYKTMSQDTMLGFYFVGHDLNHIIEQQGTFLLRAFGLDIKYEGKLPARAHSELPPILEGHFDRRLLLLGECLAREGLSQESIDTWRGFESQFRKVIVKKERPLS